MVYTLGFNPTMKVSMGIALPLFAESEGELVDIEIYDNLTPQEVIDIINPKLPEGAKIISAKLVERYCDAIEVSVFWAEYKITPYFKSNEEAEQSYDFKAEAEEILAQSEILLTKKNKKGVEKTINIKKSIGSYRFENNSLYIHLKVGQASEVPALRADDLMRLVNPDKIYEITRIKFLDEKLNEM